MEDSLIKIGFGGGCHWCTEAVFQSLLGVERVEQGYIASLDENTLFSEAVIVHFNAEKILLSTLTEIHLHTHKSTVDHSMRAKYRSAVYTFSLEQQIEATKILEKLQDEFEDKVLTKVYPFNSFKPSREEITNYYYSNPKKPFCEQFINPKLNVLVTRFSKNVDSVKLKNSTNGLS